MNKATLASYSVGDDGVTTAEIDLSRGNFSMSTMAADNTRVVIITPNGSVQVEPGMATTICVTALPSNSRKGLRTLVASKSGEATLTSLNTGASGRVTPSQSMSVESDGRMRNIVHSYYECCGDIVGYTPPAPTLVAEATPVVADDDGLLGGPLLGAGALVGGLLIGLSGGGSSTTTTATTAN